MTLGLSLFYAEGFRRRADPGAILALDLNRAGFGISVGGLRAIGSARVGYGGLRGMEFK